MKPYQALKRSLSKWKPSAPDEQTNNDASHPRYQSMGQIFDEVTIESEND